MDDIYYLDTDLICGTNLFAYCANNPIKYVDKNGCAYEWVGYLISAIEIFAGIALATTGLGAGIGISLIGLGAGSIINAVVTESLGGTFWDGYIGGLISGLGIIVGIAMVTSGKQIRTGFSLIGAGVGSNINALMTLYSGQSYFYGYISGVVQSIPSMLGLKFNATAKTFLGSMLGSIVSDFLNNGFYEINIGKALWTACIATVFSTLLIIIDDYIEKEKIVSLLMNSVNLYISMWISTANSIIGAFWMGKEKMRTNDGVKLRPNTASCCILCVVTMILSALSLLGTKDFESITEKLPGYLMSAVFMFLDVVFIIFSIFSWNSVIYIDNEKIKQKKFGREFVWYYEDMYDAEFITIGGGLYSTPSFRVIIKCQNTSKKLKFDFETKLYELFLEKAKDYPIGEFFRKNK